MYDLDQHRMELVGVDAAGAEEWHCPICGRHFLMTWPPQYSKQVLAYGDEYAIHLGGKGGLRMDAPTVLDVDTYLPDPSL
jgi:hypothetical protein